MQELDLNMEDLAGLRVQAGMAVKTLQDDKQHLASQVRQLQLQLDALTKKLEDEVRLRKSETAQGNLVSVKHMYLVDLYDDLLDRVLSRLNKE